MSTGCPGGAEYLSNKVSQALPGAPSGPEYSSSKVSQASQAWDTLFQGILGVGLAQAGAWSRLCTNHPVLTDGRVANFNLRNRKIKIFIS